MKVFPIQYSSALRSQADRFVTRNPRDIPAEFLRSLPDIP